MPPTHTFPVLALFLAVLTAAHADLGLTCADHPKPAQNPVLVRSWEFQAGETPRIVYYARFKDLQYTPVLDPASKIYKDLDLFYAAGGGKGKDIVLMHFQRPARVYLFINAFGSKDTLNNTDAQLLGWTPEGYARIDGSPDSLPFGVHQKNWFSITKLVFVFSKNTTGNDNEVLLPTQGWMLQNLKGVNTKGLHHFRISEADGSASLDPTPFAGKVIEPNVQCPKELHEAWYAADDNPDDRDTAGQKFGSWHPQWDPCYWCAYGHEHGSSAQMLMNYKPKYGYTAWKNGQEVESNTGFKDAVIDHGDLYVYISIHAQTSGMGRVTVRNHTVTIAVKRKSDLELMAELTAKGNFGFLAGRSKEGAVPISSADEAEQAEQKAAKPPRKAIRAMNVVNEGNLDGRFAYNQPPIKGRYEVWDVNPMCTTSSSKQYTGTLTMDIQNPISAIKSADFTIPERVALGSTAGNGEFYYNTGVTRTLRAAFMTISAESCGFGSDFTGGYFYTNVFGTEKRDGPGQDSVRQFIKPGFKTTLTGLYKPEGSWLGLQKTGVSGAFFDIGYGINPKVN